MSGIKAKNSKPELMVRRTLFAAGYRFRLHRRDLPGSPDIVMPGRKIAIFVHGCFWHLHQGCSYSKLPSTRPDFWKVKLEAIAEEIHIGEAAVRFENIKDLLYCDVLPLLRISERQQQFGQQEARS